MHVLNFSIQKMEGPGPVYRNSVLMTSSKANLWNRTHRGNKKRLNPRIPKIELDSNVLKIFYELLQMSEF